MVYLSWKTSPRKEKKEKKENAQIKKVVTWEYLKLLSSRQRKEQGETLQLTCALQTQQHSGKNWFTQRTKHPNTG